MTQNLPPRQTLEALRLSPTPAWLWDPQRLRLIWANAAGIASFECESLFDLIDLPFDGNDPAVQAIARYGATLAADDIKSIELILPSVGRKVPFVSDVWLHPLADGRSGVLMREVMPEELKEELDTNPAVEVPAAPQLQKQNFAAMFNVMPTPAALIDFGGEVLLLNDMAKQLIAPAASTSISSMLVEVMRGPKILNKLDQSALTSSIEQLHGVAGIRDMRLTLRKLEDLGDAYAMVVFEDITERRQLERQLREAAHDQVPPQIIQDFDAEHAFSELARQLRETLAKDVLRPKIEAPSSDVPAEPLAEVTQVTDASALEAPTENVTEAEVSPPKLPKVPKMIRNALEAADLPLIVLQQNQPVYISTKLVQMLGHQTAENVAADLDFVARCAEVKQHDIMEFDFSDGSTERHSVEVSSIPWQNGPAKELVFTGLLAVTPDTQNADLKPLVDERVKSEAASDIVQDTAAETPTAAAEEPKVVPLPAIEEFVDRRKPKKNRLQTSVTHIATARKDLSDASAEELRSILDIASDGVITMDGEGRILSLSAGAESIFGVRSSDVRDRNFGTMLSVESRKVLRDYLSSLKGEGLAAVFNDGREVQGIEKQGGTVPLFMSIGKLETENSRAKFCAVVRDITTWKRTEQDLREARDAAEASNRKKSDFIAKVSHEIRTPLNAIMGFSEIMKMERFGKLPNDQYRAYLNDIHSSGGQVLSLVNDLLDLSRMEAGKLELDFTAVDPEDAIDNAMKMLRDEATRNRVVLRKAVVVGLPRVVADMRALRQIVINLVSNAIKFTDPGGEVIISALVEHNGELVIRIKDNGLGMNADQLEDALQPFQRIAIPNRERQGSGLGLPITKALTEANRAKFEISSEAGKGTLVEVKFPTPRVLAE